MSACGGSRLLYLVRYDRVVDSKHELRIFRGQCHRAGDVVLASGLSGPEHGSKAGARHEFGLGRGSRGEADRALSDLSLGDLDALMNLYVRPDFQSRGSRVGGHGPQVLLEDRLVDEDTGRRQVLL